MTVFVMAVFPVICFAHGSHGSGVIAGLTHPIFGLDHNLAIVGIGVLSYLIDKEKWFVYPLSFLGLMVVGGVLGIGGEATVLVEKVIAASVFIVGLLCMRSSSNGGVQALLVAAFGYVHGYAHGAEMPESTTALKYILGYAVGTILLTILGVGIGRYVASHSRSSHLRYLLAGLFIGAGIVFLWP